VSDLQFRFDGPKCPHCGYVQRPDDAHYFDEDTTSLSCNSCGKDFAVYVQHMGFRWSTAPEGESP